MLGNKCLPTPLKRPWLKPLRAVRRRRRLQLLAGRHRRPNVVTTACWFFPHCEGLSKWHMDRWRTLLPVIEVYGRRVYLTYPINRLRKEVFRCATGQGVSRWALVARKRLRLFAEASRRALGDGATYRCAESRRHRVCFTGR